MSAWRLLLTLLGAALIGAGVLACGGAGSDPGGPPAFVRAPYMTRVTETAARMSWIAPPGAGVTVTATAPGRAPVRAEGGRLHGLVPDTRYAWSAALDGHEAARGAFTTAPRDLSRPLDLIAFGDYGALNDDARAVARLAAAEDARLLLTTGDNSYIVALPELLDGNIFRPLRETLGDAPNYGTVGDHDIVFPAGQRAVADAFGWPAEGERYALRYGPLQVVAIGLRGDAADLPFLRAALARPGPLARIVLVHQPIRPGSPLLPVIARAGVTAVLAGHLHAYERREVAGAPGVPFLTVGTGGAPRNEGRTPRSPDARVHIAGFGLLRVRLEATRATFAFVGVDGRERDRLVAPLRPRRP